MRTIYLLLIILLLQSCDSKKNESNDKNSFDIEEFDSIRKVKQDIADKKRDSTIKADKAAKKEKIKNTLSHLRKSENKNTGYTYYYSKKFYHYDNSNKISAYIGVDSYDNVNLFFKVSYFSDKSKWIFFNTIVVTYDEILFEVPFEYDDKKTGVEGFKYWEYISINANQDLDMHLQGIAKSDYAKIFLSGYDDYDRVITNNEKKALDEVITAYYKIIF